MGGLFPLKFQFTSLWGFVFGDGSTRQNYSTQAIHRSFFCAWAMPNMPPAPIALPGKPRLRFSYTMVSQAVGDGHIDILIFFWLLAQRLGYRVSGLRLRARNGFFSVSFVMENAGESCDEGVV